MGNLPIGVENDPKAPFNDDEIDVKIYTEEKVYREHYITVSKSFFDDISYHTAIDELNILCNQQFMLNEDEKVIDYLIE